MTSSSSPPMGGRPTVIAREVPRQVREAIENALSQHFDGPSFTWRGYLLAEILTHLASCGVFHRGQVQQLERLATRRDTDDCCITAG
jgi:uncharacterized damage-inducible protein DinB